MTMTDRRYSPKAITEYNGYLDKVIDSIPDDRLELWNLMFLVAPVENKYPLSTMPKDAVAAMWHTLHCDPRTGLFRNPGIKEMDGRRILHLLRQPPSEFVAWAESSPVVVKLPLTKVVPDWVARAKARLPKCAVHADSALVNQLDAPVNDTAQAAALLSKF